MQTKDEAYKEHLEEKYLPGRDKYLQWFFFPKLVKQFTDGHILDLGFGTGGFLRFLKSKNKMFSGIDSNPYLVDEISKQGFAVTLDDITKLDTVFAPIHNAITDNVLEHLDLNQIDSVFNALKQKMTTGGILVVIVPLEKGYQRDPTHKTFVNKEIMQQMCDKYNLRLKKRFYHPINLSGVGKWLYLNMQVYVIQF
jgi:trans-aconitate methyltransferase